MKHYLMVKTHNKTGLKYLCKKTTSDVKKCYKYLGSGFFWKRHLSKYGNDVSTKIIEVCDTIEELKPKALYWSNHYDVVKSEEWANVVIENGGNVNDRSFKQMQENRRVSLRKAFSDPEYKKLRKELGKETSLRQKGLTMKQRMYEGWTDPRKGKKMKDIYKKGHFHAQIKPFKIILNNNESEWIFGCESEIFKLGLHPSPQLSQMKIDGYIIIKHRTRHSKHQFKKGDKLTFEWLNVNEYKKLTQRV